MALDGPHAPADARRVDGQGGAPVAGVGDQLDDQGLVGGDPEVERAGRPRNLDARPVGQDLGEQLESCPITPTLQFDVVVIVERRDAGRLRGSRHHHPGVLADLLAHVGAEQIGENRLPPAEEAVNQVLLAGEGREEVEVVQVGTEEYCVNNTPPLVQQLSYLHWIHYDEEVLEYTELWPQLIRAASGRGVPVVQVPTSLLAMADAAVLLARLGETEMALGRLLEEQRKAQKRVNALKYNIIPSYRDVIKRIAEALEEEERGTLFQIKRLRESSERQASS